MSGVPWVFDQHRNRRDAADRLERESLKAELARVTVERDALRDLHSDLIGMADRFIPEESLPAWRECLDLRFADFAAYTQRLRQEASS